jgi:hypothetical protein
MLRTDSYPGPHRPAFEENHGMLSTAAVRLELTFEMDQGMLPLPQIGQKWPVGAAQLVLVALAMRTPQDSST